MFNDPNIYLKLFSIPKIVILDRIRENLGDEQFLEIVSSHVGEVSSFSELVKAGISTELLVEIVIQHQILSPQDILDLNEEYRYLGTKTLYLSVYPMADQSHIDTTLAQNEAALTEALTSIVIDDMESYKALQIRDVDSFTIENERLWEIVYSYVAFVQLTPPETEYPVEYEDLRFGFIWVNRDTPWVVVSAKDEAIAKELVLILQEQLDTTITRVALPTQVISSVESWSDIRRSGHQDHRGITRRITGSRLGAYEDEVLDLSRRDASERRTSSSYNVHLDDDTRFVLGYNGDKGILYFSKRLRTSQLRAFGVAKVSLIYSELQATWDTSPGVVIPLVVDGVVRGNQQTKQQISALLEKINEVRSQPGLTFASLNMDVLQLAGLSRYFTHEASIDCSECGDNEVIKCSACGDLRFVISEHGIQCKRCNASIQTDVLCLQDHTTNIDSLTEIVALYPTHDFYDVVEQVFQRAPQPSFNRSEESLLIRGNNLYVFGSAGEKTVYLFQDIPEFKQLETIPLPSQIDPEYVVLNEYKERCDDMSTDNCAHCVDTRVGQYCFLRLFGLYDSRYTPRPHQGHEFGDVSLDVTLNGRPNRTMLILLKKGTVTGHPITMNHKIGLEVNAQFDNFLHEPSVDIIAICVPQRLEDGFQARLRHNAERAGKKIMFMGPNELARIVAFISQNNNLHIEEL